MILDRAQAIQTALSTAQAGDVVLVAGKGHENYQIFKDKTIAFKEHDVVRKFLENRKFSSRGTVKV